MAPSVDQMAVDGGSRGAAAASAPRRLGGRVAYAVLAALPDGAEALPRSSGVDVLREPSYALNAVLRDLLQLPASKGNGGAAGMEAAAAMALAAEASQMADCGGDLQAWQALWAVCAQLHACPELADCSDFGTYLAKKYAPAVVREEELIPAKNKRFGEFARVVALSSRELLAEFDPDTASASDESDGDDEYPWTALADELDDDDRGAVAQMLRHAAKLESMGSPFDDDHSYF